MKRTTRANADGTRPATPGIEALSPRQGEVLGLVARGLTNEEIATVLGISAGTVRTHIGAILAALDVTNRTEAAVVYQAKDDPPAHLAPVDAVLVRPALAVLPVETVDGRGAAEAVGITRDLVGLFSRWCWFPVIANAATREARSWGAVDAIGHALRARFLVDAVLRVSRGQWRLNVDLVDVETARCLSSEAYDFAPDGLFVAQDRLCEAVVSATYDRLIGAVLAQPTPARPPTKLEAWELAHGGLGLQATRERQANREARERFEAALAREPTLVLAHFGLGLASYDAVLNQWLDRGKALDELGACAARCTSLAPNIAEGWYLQARHSQALGRHDLAVSALRTAIAINPSFAAGHVLLGQVLLLTGDPRDGLACMGRACRLGPRAYVAGLAAAHFTLREYELALGAAEQALATNPSYPFARVLAVASAWYLGDTARAATHAEALAALHPGFLPTRFLDTFGADVDAVARVTRALEGVAALRPPTASAHRRMPSGR